MTDIQPEPKPQITIDKQGGLHFSGSTEELHSYIDRLNVTVAWMNSNWERFLDTQELSRIAEIREWWSEDSGGAAELTPEGWPPNGSFPEPGTQAFEYMREISQLHQIAEARMIDEEEAATVS
jgi:hypothetical protein